MGVKNGISLAHTFHFPLVLHQLTPAEAKSQVFLTSNIMSFPLIKRTKMMLSWFWSIADFYASVSTSVIDMNTALSGRSLENLKKVQITYAYTMFFPVVLFPLSRLHSYSYSQIYFTHHLKKTGEPKVCQSSSCWIHSFSAFQKCTLILGVLEKYTGHFHMASPTNL